MVFAMIPMMSQEALAEEVNMYNGVVCCGDTLKIELSEYLTNDVETANVYAHFDDDDDRHFTKVGDGKYEWKVPDMYDLDRSFYIVIQSSEQTVESEWITIKMKVSELPFSEVVKDKTYTGKKQYVNNFELDLGPVYFPKSAFTCTYSNNLNVGKAAVKFTAKDNSLVGSKTVYFNIRPKGATIKTPSKSKKWIKVKWKAQKTKMSKSRISGYQVQYSTYSDFSNAKVKNVSGYKKTSKKITGLTRKTKYYVRVRTYMTVKGVKYYSTWSKTKAVKTK